MSELPPPKRGRGRPRSETADRAILDAASDILRELGYRDFTVDAVAERTGIAKTTIYRRWPTKGDLVAAAVAPMPPLSDVASIVAETRAVLHLLRNPEGNAMEVLRAVLIPRHAALASLAGAAKADALIGELLARFILEGDIGAKR